MFYACCSVSSSLPLNSIEMHQTPASATRTYIILATIVVAPPQIQATRSKEKSPTSPQFKEPIMLSISAILLAIITFSLQCFRTVSVVIFPHFEKIMRQSENSGGAIPKASFSFSKAFFSIRETYEREIFKYSATSRCVLGL